MSKTDWNEQLRHEADAMRASEARDQIAACQAGDLKGLLHSIVDQLSEADRRHSDTLRQMQDKLANMGREAQSLRPRVPSQFSAAFERVEAGMSELAARVAEVSEGHSRASEHAPIAEFPLAAPAPAQTWLQPKQPEPPMALRSAADPNAQSVRRREEEASRAQGGIDTFDVIESLPGNVANPWDQDAADALAGIYESGEASFTPAFTSGDSVSNPAGTFAPVMMAAPASQTSSGAAAMSGVDRSWLEARFSDISNHIEAQIKDIHHDQSFFALGQRLDQFERQFNSALEGVATHADVDGIRLIEAHMTELSGHLESAHQQLTRLEVIEDQLVGLADKLGDVHRAATANEGQNLAGHDPAPAIDVHAVAKAAVQQAAAHFAEIQPHAQKVEGIDEVRNMIQRLMSDNRQGEENTTALLDTLQQAMIRLLDRVDAMELTQHQNALGQTVPQDYLRDPPRFGSDNSRQHMHDNGDPLDAAVEAVATRTMTPFAQSPEDERVASPSTAHTYSREGASTDTAREASPAPERIRQDFIADARRAKMRLAAENNAANAAGDVVIKRPDAADKLAAGKAAHASAAPSAARAAVAKDKTKGTAAMSPRVMVIAIAALLAGGIYLVNPFGGQDTPVSTMTPLPAPSGSKAAKIKDPAANKEANSAAQAAPGGATSKAAEGSDAAQPANPEVQPEGAKKDGETHGEIITPDTGEITVGSTNVPLMGVAVDAEKSMTPAEIQRANAADITCRFMEGSLVQRHAKTRGPYRKCG